jgi:Na+/H+ antiporter NhaD/arsenite permease-like protein
MIALIAGLIFIVTYGFILSGKIHRAIAALSGAMLIMILGVRLQFYSQEEALRAIDFNTLGLLFGMMLIVNVLGKTGFFRYLAIRSIKVSRGNFWRLLLLLGTTTALVSMLVDNVTTILFMAPTTILIADMLGLNPIPLLMTEVLLSNIGGTATLVGDPPNVMIGSAAGFTFNQFAVHLMPPVLIVFLFSLLALRFTFRREIGKESKNTERIMRMKENEAISDKKTLWKCLFSLSLILILFLFQEKTGLLPSSIALIGATLTLALVRPDPKEILQDVEWPVLLFFGALFILIGGIEKAGIISFMGEKVLTLTGSNILLATLSLFLIAIFGSAIIDRIPFTIAMIPLIKYMSTAGLDVTPLWWGLALGVGLGGNGTPIGSSAGVVIVSLSERTRNPITLKEWLRSSSLVMLVSVVTGIIMILFFIKFFS